MTDIILHDAILQTLDRDMLHPSVGKVFMRKEDFEPTVKDWEGVPVIYAKEHPDPDLLTADLQKELDRIGGKLVGTVVGPRLNIAGHPRLESKVALKDPDMEELKDKGKLSLSTGFKSMIKDGKTNGPVTPNHVLLFEETGMDRPVDQGSWILNKTTDLIKSLKDLISRHESPGLIAIDPQMTIQVLNQQESAGEEPDNNRGEKMPDEGLIKENAMLKAEVETLKQQIAALTEKLSNQASEEEKQKEALTQAETKITELEKAKADAEAEKLNQKWLNFKEHVPEGMIKGEGKEAELEKRFKEDSASVALEVMNFKAEQPGGTEQEGSEHSSTGGTTTPIIVGGVDLWESGDLDKGSNKK